MRNLMIGSALVVLLVSTGCKRERLNEPGETTTTGADIPQVEHNVPPAPAMIPPSPAPSPAAEPMIDLDAHDIAGAGTNTPQERFEVKPQSARDASP